VPDVCDVCGGALVARPDDNPEALAVRLREYHDKTRPVLEIFQRKEYVAVVDASQSVPAVNAEIRKRLRLPPAGVTS
jgi:adenylate kinase